MNAAVANLISDLLMAGFVVLVVVLPVRLGGKIRKRNR